MTLAWFANYVKQNLKAPRKSVLEKRGFLVYCKLTYYLLTANMKVIHLSVESYSPNKDNEVWERKLIQKEPNTIDIFLMKRKKINSLARKPIPKHPQM